MILWQSFSLTLLNEWGDRSQFSTIALAAVHDAHSVFIGGSLGHLFCTALAVLGGKLLSNKIPEKTVTECRAY
jgi:putative Ca2+/H+ antiporter (TMEM165/GDT1 family)